MIINQTFEVYELLKAKQGYKLLISRDPNIVARFDRKFRYVYIHSTSADELGPTVKLFAGKTNKELGMPEDLADNWQNAISAVFNEGKEKVIEINYATPGGIRCYYSQLIPEFNQKKEVETVLSITRDITELKRKEALRRENESFYLDLIETSPDTIAIQSEGKIVFVNSAGVRLMGANSPKQIVGKSLVDFFKTNIDKVDENKNLKKTAGVITVEETLMRLDGGMIDVEMSAVPFSYRNEQAVRVVIRDISAAKLEEEEKKRLLRQIMQNEKLVSMGKLAGGVAHEINNPLTSILATAELLLEDMENEKEYREDMKQIVSEAKRIKETVRSFLGFSRSREYDFKYHDINMLIENALTVIGRGKLEKINIVRNYSSNLKKVNVSRFHIEEVFINVITNALHSMENEGTLTIITNKEKNDIVVSIKDTGRGIEKEDFDKIFEPNYTTKKKKGTGLGLSTSILVMDNHKGRIEVKSEGLGEGAEFKLFVPANSNNGELNNIVQKVIVVSNEKKMTDMFKKVIGKFGWELDVVESAEIGLKLMEMHKYGIAFIEAVIGDMNSVEFINRIEQIYPEMNIVMVSNTEDIRAVKKVVAGRVELIIEKPFTIGELISIVEKILKD